MFWLASAFAADLDVVTSVALDAPASTVAPYGTDWLVAGPDGAFAVTSAGTFSLASERLVAGASADLDADGEPDALLCGRDGLWFTSAAGELWIGDGECTGLAADDTGWVAILDGEAATYTLVAGAPVGPEAPLAGTSWTNPVLGAGPGRWLVGERAASTVAELSASGAADVDAGGPVTAAVWADRWWLGRSDDVVFGVGSVSFAVGAPKALAAGDIDGDGTDDLVVLSSGVLTVAATDGTTLLSLAVDASALGVGDVDGDGCAEVALLEDAGETLTVLANPACPVDADHDGYTDDCDDTDPTIHPGAEDVCNGTDDDCDGSVDEDGLAVTAPDAVAEGDDFTVSAAWCGGDAVLSVDPGSSFTCTIRSPSSVDCHADNDGSMTLHAIHGELERSATITAANLPPVWSGPEQIEAGQAIALAGWTSDPGDDPITFVPDDLPDGASLSADGTLSLEAWCEGTVTFDLVDDAGASTGVSVLVFPLGDTGWGGDTSDTGSPWTPSDNPVDLVDLCFTCSGFCCSIPMMGMVGLFLLRKRP